MARMFFHEHVNVSNEHVSPNKYFQEYIVDVDGILLDTWDEILGDMEGYFTTCHG
jgi:hypothetical protein